MFMIGDDVRHVSFSLSLGHMGTRADVPHHREAAEPMGAAEGCVLPFETSGLDPEEKLTCPPPAKRNYKSFSSREEKSQIIRFGEWAL